MWFFPWIRWYKKPEYRDIKQYSAEVKEGKRSLSPGGRNQGLIPPHLSLSKVLANTTCSPMSLHDFYMYLKHIEYSPENLEFYLWFKNYEAQWDKQVQCGHSGLLKDEETLVNMSQSNSSEEELKMISEAGMDDFTEIQITSQPATEIIQTAIPTVSSCSIQRPKPCVLDRLKSLAKPSANVSCKSAVASGLGTDAAFNTHEALESVIQLYLLPSSPKELNIPPAMRDAALEALQNSPDKDPRHLAPIAAHVYALLQTCSHPNFLRLGVANGTLETVCVATSLGIVLTVVGFLFVFLRAFVPFKAAHSRYEVFGAWGFWFLGLSLILSGVRGSCFFLLLFSRRQPLPWERFEDEASVKSGTSGVMKILGRLMIFDRKLRVKDIHLRRLQRKIVLQSLLGGAIFATIGVLFFIFFPIWRETV